MKLTLKKLKSAVVEVKEPKTFNNNSAALGYKVQSDNSESKDKTYLNVAPSTIIDENIQEAAIVNNESDLKTKVLGTKHRKDDVSQTSQLAYNLDDEIETLLNQAQLSIEVDEALKMKACHLRYQKLINFLLEAEESIGQSFRTKVFHFVKNSFKKTSKQVSL